MLKNFRDHAFYVDIFVAKEYSGTIIEYIFHSFAMKHNADVLQNRTDEMRPQWFSTASEGLEKLDDMLPIPYDKMWADDVFWMPLLLADRPFIGRADLDKDNTMEKWWFAEKTS